MVIIENEFDVAATPAEVYALMLDPERVGSCIAGAQVTGRRDDGSYDAKVTVKLGPVKMAYLGTIAIVESDAEARTATMLAKGAEERGQGTAQATLHMSVAEREGGGSHVSVSADMLVTGRVAQMGRGVMQDVARRMIGQMAQNMEALLSGGAVVESGDAVSAGSLLGSAVADRAKRLFGSHSEPVSKDE